MRQQTSFSSEYIAVLRQTLLKVWIAMARQSKPSQALAGRHSMVSLLSFASKTLFASSSQLLVGVGSISLKSSNVPILGDLLPLVYLPFIC